MSTLIERLNTVMQAMGWEHADLVRVSGQSSSVVSQWLGNGSKIIKTIGKMEAAEAIAMESGFSALWIAKGIGPQLAHQAATSRTLSLPDLLDQLGQHLAQVKTIQRAELGELLKAWVQSGGKASYVPLVADCFREPPPQETAA